MKKKRLEKGALKELFIKLDTIEKFIYDSRNVYPLNSHIFSSSIPPELDTKESIVDYFKHELGKLNFISAKLNNWFDFFEKRELNSFKIEEYKRTDFKNLTVTELYFAFKPINSRTQQPYTRRSVSNLITNSSMVKPVVKAGYDKFSPVDFERFLIAGGISYNKNVSDEILNFMNGVEDGFTPRKITSKMLMIRRQIEGVKP